MVKGILIALLTVILIFSPSVNVNACEHDDCFDPCPTHSPRPTKSPTPTPTFSPSPSPTQFETQTPAPTQDPNDKCTNIDGIQDLVPDGWFQISNDSTFCRHFEYGGPPQSNSNQNVNTSQGQVLGASVMAGAGSFQENFYLSIMIIGALFIKKAFKKAI